LLSGKITRDVALPLKGAFAQIVLQENICPFLTDAMLCRIHQTYGESYLSVKCSTFPRHYNMVNGQLELSLDFSCPQAARLALRDPLPLRFSLADLKDDPRLEMIPTRNLSEQNYPNREYPYFADVRAFIIALLQNGNYDFEDRLIILGRFCNDLHLLRNHLQDEVLLFIQEYVHLLDSCSFHTFIASIPTQPAAMLRTLVNLLAYRLKTGVTGNRFVACMDQFKKGLHYTNELPDEVLANRYQEVRLHYYDNYMQQHKYIFENYFVNYAFKTLFPFANQTSMYSEDIFTVQKTVFTEYMLLVLRYAMLKNLLVGMAGYYEEQFATEHALQLIQSFDKNIGHDIPYLQKLLQFFKDHHALDFACAAMLIKN